MESPATILKKYWGYDSFREMQLPIIESVLAGNDTLGLLPTGGGKSLTFQIPSLLMEGLTLVITPLISLMKDQVDNLLDRGIRACVIHSGLSRAEQKLSMDRCRLGKSKLLYLSPEKLQSKQFIAEISQFDISMIVVDEAHCISQWGYDFRPSYLRISVLRKCFPKAMMLALTASATPEVSQDIMDKLEFRSRIVFSKSFTRPNISYIVRHTDHKPEMLMRVLRATSGSAIVYVRSRKRTREMAQAISAEGIPADYYHAGLSSEEKNSKQNRWKSGNVRVIVATNAFGMGIDKPDVRTVIHIDPPSSLEEYYQEAGRAGRDGLPSFAVLIAAKNDKATLTRRLNESFPEKDTIRHIYELACNFLDIAVGTGYNTLHEFNFALFCERFKLNPRVVRNSFALLTNAGYIDYIDEVTTRTRMMVTLNKNELYNLTLDSRTDQVFQLLLRTYTGLFSDYVYISEDLISSRLRISVNEVYEALLALSRLHAIHFIPRKTTPYMLFTTSRELTKHIMFPKAIYEDMRERMARRIDSMKRFIFSDDHCRVDTMLEYFGEKPKESCGTCDVCRERKKILRQNQAQQQHDIEAQIIRLASQPHPTSINYIAEQLSLKTEKIVPIIRSLMDTGTISIKNSIVSLVNQQNNGDA